LNVFWWFLTHVVVSGRYAERPLKRHLGSGVSQEDLCVISAISSQRAGEMLVWGEEPRTF
jgi:hypothetical protein